MDSRHLKTIRLQQFIVWVIIQQLRIISLLTVIETTLTTSMKWCSLYAFWRMGAVGDNPENLLGF
jgi:hypothetical protein